MIIMIILTKLRIILAQNKVLDSLFLQINHNLFLLRRWQITVTFLRTSLLQSLG